MGTSEESTAGGVVTLYGHVFASGAAFGSALATGTPTKAVAVKNAAAAVRLASRRDAGPKVGIVCAD